MRAAGSTIRSRLLLLVLAATMPMLAFSAVLLYRSYRASIGLVEESAIGIARRVATSVDFQISRAEAVGLALAQLPAGEISDPTDFEDAAQRAMAAAGLDTTLLVMDRTGRVIAETNRAPGAVSPRVLGADAGAAVFETGRTYVTNLLDDSGRRRPQVAVQMPMLRDGRVRYAIEIVLPAYAISSSAAPGTLPDGWFAIIVDRGGRVLAETNAAVAETGQPVPPALAALVGLRAEGFGRLQLTPRQLVLTGFTHTDRTGWTVAVGVAASVVTGPALRAIVALGAGGAVLLLAGLGFAWSIGRSIARPVNHLAAQAARLGRDEPIDGIAARGLAETEAASRALRHAAGQLAARAEERRIALRRAEASETRLEADVAARTRELAQSEQRFRTYFEHSAEALLVIAVEAERFVFETINRSGELLFGLRAEAITGREVASVLPPATAERLVAAYQTTVAQREPVTIEHAMLLPSGELELETVLVPIHDLGGGAVIRLITGSRDLTRRKRLEARLADAQRLESIGALTGGIAHDFNNMLTVIIGNASLLRRRLGEDARLQRYVRSIESAADRGARLTASLLAFSRQQMLRIERIDVAQLLQASEPRLRRTLVGVPLTLDLEPGLPPAQADASQLEAAIQHLLANARDAVAEIHHRPGNVLIRLGSAMLTAPDLEGNDEARPGPFLALEVRDNGIGMRQETRNRAFEPFFTTKEIGQGTGLGLSQVFGTVRQLGGHVKLESAPAEGTSVTLFLPAAQTTPAQALIRPALRVPPGRTVLLVEDDPTIREVTAEVLSEAGLRVISAADGPAALAILQDDQPIDLLFSDIAMPGTTTGLELARQACLLRPHLAVLLTSGFAGQVPPESAFDVLPKPYSRAALLDRIAAKLGS